MSVALLLKFWREILILLLALSLALSIHFGNHARTSLAIAKAEDRALYEKAKADSDQKQREDQEHYNEAKQTYEDQIKQLASDHTVASMRLCNKPSSGAMPTTPSSTAGTTANSITNIPQPIAENPDIGPYIDSLTRECDALAVRHKALVDWVTGTR